MHYYQHNISDFNNETRHLTRVERALYRDAIELYYDTEQPLCGDFERLSRRLIALEDQEKLALKMVLDEFFDLTDDGYRHEKCEADIAKYRENARNKAKAGNASATARQQKSTRVKQAPNKCATNQEPITNNHKPITINQEPIINDDLPPWLDVGVWESFKKYRGKKFTAHAQQLMIKRLQRFHDEGQNIISILETSITNGWSGIFPEKRAFNKQATLEANNDAVVQRWLEGKNG